MPRQAHPPHHGQMITVRCVRCDHVFRESALPIPLVDTLGEWRCPACRTHCFPGRAFDVVTLSISWQRLRFLAELALTNAEENGDDQYVTLRAILSALRPYRPEGALPLTLEDYRNEKLSQGHVPEL